MFYSNCLFYVIRRRFQSGGYIVTRKSHYGWWWHFLWSYDLITFEQFLPVSGGRSRFFPPIVFKGYVKIGKDSLCPSQDKMLTNI